MGPDNKTAIALGDLKASLSPALRVVETLDAQSMVQTSATDVGNAFTFDFRKNVAGMVQLNLPAGHGLPKGTELRIEHGEVIQGKAVDIDGMCKLCPGCGSCASPGHAPQTCDDRGDGAVCDTYCHTGPAKDHPLRHEPCYPHQSYTPGFPAGGIPAHETPDRYIGDFNNANMTNLYIVRGDGSEERYTPYFAAAGFRYAQLSGLPAGVTPKASWLTALSVHSDVPSAASLVLPSIAGTTFGTSDVLMRIHNMTRASQTGNLWSIPTDCPQRERRGWMGDAQASADEAAMNFDMQLFYEEFLNKIRDDQLRFNGNHPTDTGALADVVPFDGIGGNPGCPIWQVAYIVIGRQLWKHYGEDALPSLRKHYTGMKELMGWFDRHADPSDGLLVHACYGDWMGFNPESHNSGSSALTPRDSVTAFYHVLAMQYLAQVAEAVGETSDAASLLARHKKGQAGG
jgi:hypothetical protein